MLHHKSYPEASDLQFHKVSSVRMLTGVSVLPLKGSPNMKTQIAIALLVALLSPLAQSAVCKVKTNDIGSITGKGSTQENAFLNAAEQCFERREKLHKMKKGTGFDEDTGVAVIDSCANITCS